MLQLRNQPCICPKRSWTLQTTLSGPLQWSAALALRLVSCSLSALQLRLLSALQTYFSKPWSLSSRPASRWACATRWAPLITDYWSLTYFRNAISFSSGRKYTPYLGKSASYILRSVSLRNLLVLYNMHDQLIFSSHLLIWCLHAQHWKSITETRRVLLIVRNLRVAAIVSH